MTDMMSTKSELRVGVIGADNQASWAKLSHVPALADVPGVRLAAVATRSEESAKEAASAFGAEHWFADPFAMVRSQHIDIVSVCVRVPAHRELVLAALAAGKAVYCEAPLGRDVAEADEMTAAAAVAGAHVAIGLQARSNPAAKRAAELIASGAIGRPLTARIVSTSAGFGPAFPAMYDYFNKAESGANLSTVTVAHTLDLLEAVLGHIEEVEARTAILFPTVLLVDTEVHSVRETADQVSVIGMIAGGCVFTADINGGIALDQAKFILEIRGTEGSLSLTGGHPFGVQAGDLVLAASVPFDAPDNPASTGGLMGAAINVGEVYVGLAHDIREGTSTVADFAHGARVSRLIAAVTQAAETGHRQSVA